MTIVIGEDGPTRGATGEQVPVLICGSGPVGLILSILLSRQGIRNLVIEKREGINTLPRARGLTVRTIEILDQLGLHQELEAIALPPLWTRYFIYTEKLAGQIIGRMPTDAMQQEHATDRSPARYIVAAQDRIDPMLYRAARQYSEAEIRFSTEAVDYSEDAEGITTTVRSPNGISSQIRSIYLIGADGGRSGLRKLAGIGETGRENLRSYVNNHIRADLSRFTAGREGTLIWTLAPGVEGLFQMLDGGQKWAVQVQYDPKVAGDDVWTDEVAVKQVRAMIGDPAADDVNIEILKAYRFTLSMMVSDRLRKGRLVLTGDAAHQVPPYGGFGLNTGIQSAHNLAWKLGAVIRGEAPPALLDTYDGERREVAGRVCAFGRVNAGYIEEMMTAVREAKSTEEKSAIVKASSQYGNWWGLDLGVHYEGPGAFVPDDIPAPSVKNPVTDYIPHAKPGYRAPHFWVTRGGTRISSITLFDGAFVLLTGSAGQAWIDAVRDPEATWVPNIQAYRVAQDGDLVPETDFCALYGLGSSGAVLVRPDGHVAYRAPEIVEKPAKTLQGILDVILRRQH
jgi:2-polyprenyl-6-methoxyphenol hydroxylase-like FAD-dependent oxidoreductase